MERGGIEMILRFLAKFFEDLADQGDGDGATDRGENRVDCSGGRCGNRRRHLGSLLDGILGNVHAALHQRGEHGKKAGFELGRHGCGF